MKVNSTKNYVTDIASFLIDVAVAALIWKVALSHQNPYIVAIGIPLAIRAVLFAWKFYTYFKKAILFSAFEQKRASRAVSDQFMELDLPAPPLIRFGEVFNYLDAVANAGDAKPEHIYAAGFLTGSLKGLLQVSFFQYRLALWVYREALTEYRDQLFRNETGLRSDGTD